MFWYSSLIMIDAPHLLIWICGFLTFTGWGLILSTIILTIMMFYWKYSKKLNLMKLIDAIVYLSFLSHLFFTRGIFKYYFVFHVPLILIWFCFHFQTKSENIQTKKIFFILFISISIFIIILPRYLYLLLILGILIYLLLVHRSTSHYNIPEKEVV